MRSNSIRHLAAARAAKAHSLAQNTITVGDER